jgi:hypothetical protein
MGMLSASDRGDRRVPIPTFGGSTGEATRKRSAHVRRPEPGTQKGERTQRLAVLSHGMGGPLRS